MPFELVGGAPAELAGLRQRSQRRERLGVLDEVLAQRDARAREQVGCGVELAQALTEPPGSREDHAAVVRHQPDERRPDLACEGDGEVDAPQRVARVGEQRLGQREVVRRPDADVDRGPRVGQDPAQDARARLDAADVAQQRGPLQREIRGRLRGHDLTGVLQVTPRRADPAQLQVHGSPGEQDLPEPVREPGPP
ncbi:hypothetical protein BJF78_27975 [Pseudonocardia sp. CNS-139]|nr:hypothetical protein BJF78_27975 [Pseudonocardia sp. CNS-139]